MYEFHFVTLFESAFLDKKNVYFDGNAPGKLNISILLIF